MDSEGRPAKRDEGPRGTPVQMYLQKTAVDVRRKSDSEKTRDRINKHAANKKNNRDDEKEVWRRRYSVSSNRRGSEHID